LSDGTLAVFGLIVVGLLALWFWMALKGD